MNPDHTETTADPTRDFLAEWEDALSKLEPLLTETPLAIMPIDHLSKAFGAWKTIKQSVRDSRWHNLPEAPESPPDQPAANPPAFPQEYACTPTGPDGKPIHHPLTKEQVLNNIRLIQDLSKDPAVKELTSILLERGIA